MSSSPRTAPSPRLSEQTAPQRHHSCRLQARRAGRGATIVSCPEVIRGRRVEGSRFRQTSRWIVTSTTTARASSSPGEARCFAHARPGTSASDAARNCPPGLVETARCCTPMTSAACITALPARHGRRGGVQVRLMANPCFTPVRHNPGMPKARVGLRSPRRKRRAARGLRGSHEQCASLHARDGQTVNRTARAQPATSPWPPGRIRRSG